MMNGLIFLRSVEKAKVLYRHPNESKLAQSIGEARDKLSELLSIYTSRMLEFRTEDDVWIKTENGARIGLIRSPGGNMEFVLQEDEAKRNLSELELSELVGLFQWLPKLKRAVISESIDYLSRVNHAIEEFRKVVMDLDGGSEASE